MPHEGRRAWILLVVTVISYTAYAIIILGRAGATPVASTPYAATLLWIVGSGSTPAGHS